ncbi:MAG: tetratricopeptide repeat protein [Bacteroidaceae bacterium]|nr:tetratricopeptide repeat protein [Bacteroidaceae bacterium]
MARLRRLVFLFLVLACSMSAGAQEGCRGNDSVAHGRALDYYYIQARSHLMQDSIDRCFELLRHCYALDPSSASVMFDLSSFYAFLKKDSVSHAMLSKVVESDPQNSDYNKALVNYYLNAGDIESAIEVYEKMLETGHSKSETYEYLYSLYAEAGKHDKAIEALEKLEKLEGSNEEITFQKLRQYMSVGDSAKAVAAVYRLIDENPDDSRCWTLLGNAYSLLGDREKAVKAIDKALSLRPDDGYALSSLATIYVNDADDSMYCNVIERLLISENIGSEARLKALVQYIEYKYPTDSARVGRLMGEMIKLPFDMAEIANVHAQYLVLANAPSDTIVSAFERVLALEPENVSAIIKLLGYAIDRNDDDAVIKYTDEALPYLPDKLELYYYKGISYYMQKRYADAISVYEEGLRKRGEETAAELVSEVYALLGDLYHEQSMIDECMQAYDSALVYDSSNMSVLNNYAYYLSLDGKELQRALDMSYKTIVAEPDNATYIDTYAWVLFKLGRYEEAKAYAEKLIALNDMSVVVYSHCGDIYAKCGDIESAVKYWIMARDAGDNSKLLEKKIKKRRYYEDAKRRK